VGWLPKTKALALPGGIGKRLPTGLTGGKSGGRCHRSTGANGKRDSESTYAAQARFQSGTTHGSRISGRCAPAKARGWRLLGASGRALVFVLEKRPPATPSMELSLK
jgi:hypothetical protein